MKRVLFLFLISFTLMSADIEVSDVNYKSSVTFQGVNYKLNGAGIREKFFLDLYTIGLYVTDKSNNGNQIIDSGKDKFVQIVVVSGLITADRFSKGMNDGFEKSTGGNVEPIQSEIGMLKKGFGADFNVGDKFTVFFKGDGGTKIYKEGKLKIEIPPNKTFQKALLGMWIGPNPVVGSLKEELLGID